MQSPKAQNALVTVLKAPDSWASGTLLKNLTAEIARQTMRRLAPNSDPWGFPAIHRKAVIEVCGPSAMLWPSGDGGFKTVECFGPEGEKKTIWSKPDDFEERYAAILSAERERVAATGAKAS